MNPRKPFHWRLCVLVLLAAAAFGASPKGMSGSVDPIVGDWLWRHNATVTFNADGTVHHSFGADGTWEYQPNPEGLRQYRIVWQDGKSIDEVSCGEDGQIAHVRNQAAKLQFDVRRLVPDKPAASPAPAPAAPGPALAPPVKTPVAGSPAADVADPIVGQWQWTKGSTATFMADGTVTCSNGLRGVWMFLRNPDAKRKYVLDWRYGTYTDHLSYNLADGTGQLSNQLGDRFNVSRGAAESQETVAPGKPASYFGAPGQ